VTMANRLRDDVFSDGRRDLDISNHQPLIRWNCISWFDIVFVGLLDLFGKI
jgi:hypothetical protein